jgi:hypothetical protein
VIYQELYKQDQDWHHFVNTSCLCHPLNLKFDEASNDADWVNAMHEELNNFKRNKVWELVERPKGHNVIETK